MVLTHFDCWFYFLSMGCVKIKLEIFEFEIKGVLMFGGTGEKLQFEKEKLIG